MKRVYLRLISAVLLIASLVSLFSASVSAELDLRNYPFNGNYFITTYFWDFMAYGGAGGVHYATTDGPYLSFWQGGLNPSDKSFKNIYIASDIEHSDIAPVPSDFTLKGEILFSGFTFNSLRISCNNGLTYSAVTNFHAVDNCLSFSLDFSGISNFTGINILASVTLLSDPSDSTKYQDFRFFGTSLKMVKHDSESITSFKWDPQPGYALSYPSKNVANANDVIMSLDAERTFDSNPPISNTISGSLFPSLSSYNSINQSYCIAPVISDSFLSKYGSSEDELLHYSFPFRVLGNIVDIAPFYINGSGITPIECDLNLFVCDSSAYDADASSEYEKFSVAGTQYVLSPVTDGLGQQTGVYKVVEKVTVDQDIEAYYRDFNYDLSRNTLGVISFSCPSNVRPVLYFTTSFGSAAVSPGIYMSKATVSASYDLSMSESEKMWVDIIEKNFDAFLVYLDSIAINVDLSRASLGIIEHNAANLYRLLQAIDEKFDVQLANEEQMLAYLKTISDNLVPDQQQMEQFRDDKYDVDNSIYEIQGAESVIQGDVNSALAEVPDFASGLAGLGAAFMWISQIADLSFSSLGSIGIVFTFPLFLGVFFYLTSRAPGSTSSRVTRMDSFFDRFKKRK